MAKPKHNKQKPAVDIGSELPLFPLFGNSMIAGAVVIVVAATLAYLPALTGGFIFDDDALLTNSNLIKAADGLFKFWFTTEPHDYWPLLNSMFWIEWRLWGMDATPYHVVNLILHCSGSILIWSVLQRLSIPGAFLAALLFAIHPVNVETVAWISQRKGLLALFFYLLSILWYLKSETALASEGRTSAAATNRWYWLSLGAFVLAMLSKGTVAILPGVLLLGVWWRRPLQWRDGRRVAPFLLVGGVLAGVNMWFQTHGAQTAIRSAGFLDRILGATAALWFYLCKAFVPVNLILFYPQWEIDADQLLWWVPLFAAGTCTALLWWYRNTWGRPFLFAWAYFCIALLPVLGFTDVGYMQYSLVADHYQHIALIGVTALAAAGWERWYQTSTTSTWVPLTTALILAALLTALSWRQSSLYADATTLYRVTLERNPGSWLAHDSLGFVLSQAGRVTEAIRHHQEALRLKPDFTNAHSNLGMALLETGRPREAIDHLLETLRRKPNFAEAHNNVCNALNETGQTQKAIIHCKQAIELIPDYPEAYNNLGNALRDSGQLQEAIEQFEHALRLRPGYAIAHNNLGIALAKAGDLGEAIAHFKEALRLNPNYPDAQRNLQLAQTMQQHAGD